jgi:hypothetical protein
MNDIHRGIRARKDRRDVEMDRWGRAGGELLVDDPLLACVTSRARQHL